MDNRLLGIPFDQFGRYDLVRRSIKLFSARAGREPAKVSVLDVGGYPGLIRDFLPDYSITVADTVDEEGEGYVKVDGTDMAFADDSFDVVTSTDVLEHISSDDRRKFIAENLRVAKSLMILIAPFKHDPAPLFEQILAEYTKGATGIEHRFLKEHIVNGLPDEAVIEDLVAKAGYPYVKIPNGYLYHWMLMMLARLNIDWLPNASTINELADRYYNSEWALRDNRAPAYRTAYIVSKKRDNGLLEEIRNECTCADQAGLNEGEATAEIVNKLFELYQADRADQAPALKTRIKELTVRTNEQDHTIEGLRSIIEQREQTIGNLETWIEEIHDRLPYKVYQRFRMLLGQREGR